MTFINEDDEKDNFAKHVLSTYDLALVPVTPATPVDLKEDQLSENGGRKNVCGLFNLGNTCFMNATLQSLFATVFLRDSILRSKEQLLQNCTSDMAQFMERLHHVFTRVNSSRFSSIYINQMHSSLAKIHPAFADFKQHDSQEFLLFLLNCIHEVLNKHAPTSSVSQNGRSIGTDSITVGVAKRLKVDLANDDETPSSIKDVALSPDGQAWSKHLESNKSIITESLQGQFKSVIRCEKCCFVSETYEPFMSLSVPIPHAMEKQIMLTWVPAVNSFDNSSMSSVTKFLVTVSKHCTLGEVKHSFLRLLNNEHVDKSKVILVQVKQSANVNILDDRTLISYLSATSELFAIEVLTADFATTEEMKMDFNNEERDEKCKIDEKENEKENNMKQQDNHTDKFSETMNVEKSEQDVLYTKENYKMDDKSAEANQSSEKTKKNIQEELSSWHSCSICLEEMYDSNLSIHAVCGGMMCQECLQATHDFNQGNKFKCPTCNMFIASSGYQSLAQNESPEIRKLLVPVLFRKGADEPRLFGHPTVCCLLTQTPGSTLKQLIEQIVNNMYPLAKQYSIYLTDSLGTICWFCDKRSCSGCTLPEDDVISVKPGSCITVDFQHENVIAQTLKEDDSMQTLRQTDYVSLEECVQKFTEIEYLGNDNPWFCMKCKVNQPATKCMSVVRWPSTLIVHLKRFHYEESVCTKIDFPVHFPLDSFKPTSCSSSYQLYACICHSGTLYGGHYTAFAKSQDTWHYFNDRTFSELTPGIEKSEEVYVFFYKINV